MLIYVYNNYTNTLLIFNDNAVQQDFNSEATLPSTYIGTYPTTVVHLHVATAKDSLQ